MSGLRPYMYVCWGREVVITSFIEAFIPSFIEVFITSFIEVSGYDSGMVRRKPYNSFMYICSWEQSYFDTAVNEVIGKSNKVESYL